MNFFSNRWISATLLLAAGLAPASAQEGQTVRFQALMPSPTIVVGSLQAFQSEGNLYLLVGVSSDQALRYNAFSPPQGALFRTSGTLGGTGRVLLEVPLSVFSGVEGLTVLFQPREADGDADRTGVYVRRDAIDVPRLPALPRGPTVEFTRVAAATATFGTPEALRTPAGVLISFPYTATRTWDCGVFVLPSDPNAKRRWTPAYSGVRPNAGRVAFLLAESLFTDRTTIDLRVDYNGADGWLRLDLPPAALLADAPAPGPEDPTVVNDVTAPLQPPPALSSGSPAPVKDHDPRLLGRWRTGAGPTEEAREFRADGSASWGDRLIMGQDRITWSTSGGKTLVQRNLTKGASGAPFSSAYRFEGDRLVITEKASNGPVVTIWTKD